MKLKIVLGLVAYPQFESNKYNQERQPFQKLLFLSSEKGCTLNGKNLLPGSKFFPFRDDLFHNEIGVQKSKQ